MASKISQEIARTNKPSHVLTEELDRFGYTVYLCSCGDFTRKVLQPQHDNRAEVVKHHAKHLRDAREKIALMDAVNKQRERNERTIISVSTPLDN